MSVNVYCAVLAAGRSSRFGDTKQLACVDGDTLVARAAVAADAACPGRSLLIAGHDARQVITASGNHCRATVINDRYREGIGTSIACAVRAVQHAADGLLITLADQPRVTSEHLAALLAAFQLAPEIAVASRYDGTLGPPAVLPRSMFADLVMLKGDRGAKHWLMASACNVIDCEAAAKDIDRPGDLADLD
ncbi:MAG: nucleotidyltransferase family protein [Pseudomonadota bacterium]